VVRDEAGVRFGHDRRAQLPSPLYLTEEQITAFFAAARCPALVVTGEEGIPFPPDRVAARLACFGAGARRVVVPGRHHLHADPDTSGAVLGAIDAYLRGLGLLV